MIMFKDSRSMIMKEDKSEMVHFNPLVTSGVTYIKTIEKIFSSDTELFSEKSYIRYMGMVIPYKVKIRTRNEVIASFIITKGLNTLYPLLTGKSYVFKSNILDKSHIAIPMNINEFSKYDIFSFNNFIYELHHTNIPDNERDINQYFIEKLILFPVSDTTSINYVSEDNPSIDPKLLTSTVRDNLFTYYIPDNPENDYTPSYALNLPDWEPLIDQLNLSIITDMDIDFSLVETNKFHVEYDNIHYVHNRYNPYMVNEDLITAIHGISKSLEYVNHYYYKHDTPGSYIDRIKVIKTFLDMVYIILINQNGELLATYILDLGSKTFISPSLLTRSL